MRRSLVAIVSGETADKCRQVVVAGSPAQPLNHRRRAAVGAGIIHADLRRTAQARQTRAAVVEAARQLFLRDGYAATTIAVIAARARVSVETIYKAFGGKAGLVRAICDAALAGEGPVPAEAQSDELQGHEPDPRKIIWGWGEVTAEIAPRISPILLLVRSAAAADPEMAGLRAEMDAGRLSRMIRNARTSGRLGTCAMRSLSSRPPMSCGHTAPPSCMNCLFSAAGGQQDATAHSSPTR
jgi:AcrR family transcriptional regulator